MRIIIKYLLRNIKEKKLRTLLVLFSIILSTALMFSTISIPKTIEKMITDELKKATGSAEIIIYADPTTLKDPFFDLVEIESLNKELEYTIGAINGNGFYKDGKEILIRGYELEDLFTIHDSTLLIEVDETKPFSHDAVIIGSGAAKIFNLSLGDIIEVVIDGVKYQFQIYAIATSKGIFDYDNKTFNIVVPKSTLASIYDVSDLVNMVFIKTVDNGKVEQVLDTLSIYYPDLIVRTTVTQKEIQQNISMITTPFSLMLVLVIFISIFIIYTTFKVVTVERLPIVGTFRSIGATKKMTVFILLGESIIYGMIGGILGNILGIVILYYMMRTLAYNHYTKVMSTFELTFGIKHILLSFLLAILISIISAIYPIIKVSKKPVKDIILHNVKEKEAQRKVNFLSGLIFIVVSFIIIYIIPIKVSLIGCFILLIGLVLATIFIVPEFASFFGKLFIKINRLIFRNEGVLAAKNIGNDKNIINNITLLTIGLAVILMINIFSTSIIKETINAYNKANFDIYYYHQKADGDVIKRLKNIKGVEDAYGYYHLPNIRIKEKNDYVNLITGVDLEAYLEYWDFELLGNQEAILHQFNQERTIVTSLILKEKFGLQEGDMITLQFRTGEAQYKVIGFINTIFNNGNFFLLPIPFIKEDTGIHYYSEVLIKTSKEANQQNIKDLIKREFKHEPIKINLLSEIKEDNVKTNNQYLTLLKGFSIIAMLIGAFGIINNFIVSLMSRKRSIGMYRSIGMAKMQVLKMFLAESFTVGILGSICGILFGIFYIQFADYIMDVLNLSLKMYYEWEIFIIIFVCGILLSIIASISPALKTAKQNIIEGIKYE